MDNGEGESQLFWRFHIDSYVQRLTYKKELAQLPSAQVRFVKNGQSVTLEMIDGVMPDLRAIDEQVPELTFSFPNPISYSYEKPDELDTDTAAGTILFHLRQVEEEALRFDLNIFSAQSYTGAEFKAAFPTQAAAIASINSLKFLDIIGINKSKNE
jgi:hypothetical protein